MISDVEGSDIAFNLIDEPWIPCIFDDGYHELSLRQLFEEAPKIRTLSGDVPQHALPLLRLALAILYRAHADIVPGYDQSSMIDLWKRIWQAGNFDLDVIDTYLDTFHDRFFLLYQDHPFFQTPDIEYVGEKSFDPVSEMIADVPKPGKFLFSMREQNSIGDISFAEAARYLVFLQAYDTAGIKTPIVGNTHINSGKVYAPKGVIGTGWLGAIGGLFVEGNNLFETLMLNWCLYEKGSDAVLLGHPGDLPPWERLDRAKPDLEFRPCSGPVDALTRQSRRIRLVPDRNHSRIIGLVSCYGDIAAPHNTNDSEKMTAWRESEPQMKKLGLSAPPLMPVTHDASKSLWRGLEPILQVADGRRDLRPGVIKWVEELRKSRCFERGTHTLSIATIHAQGMTYGTQSSVYETGIDDSVRLDTAMFRKDYPAISIVVKLVSETERAVGTLVTFVKNLQTSAGSKTIGSQSQASSQQIKEEAYSELDDVFRERLAGFSEDEDYETYGNQWRDDVHRLLLDKGGEYLSQANVPVFEEHEADKIGVMGASRAQLLFYSGLNKILGSLPEQHNDGDTRSNE